MPPGRIFRRNPPADPGPAPLLPELDLADLLAAPPEQTSSRLGERVNARLQNGESPLINLRAGTQFLPYDSLQGWDKRNNTAGARALDHSQLDNRIEPASHAVRIRSIQQGFQQRPQVFPHDKSYRIPESIGVLREPAIIHAFFEREFGPTRNNRIFAMFEIITHILNSVIDRALKLAKLVNPVGATGRSPTLRQTE